MNRPGRFKLQAAEDKMKAEGINKEYAGMAGARPSLGLWPPETRSGAREISPRRFRDAGCTSI